jgi:hypothetical protein
MNSSDIPDSWIYADSVTAVRRALLATPASYQELVAIAKGEIREIRARAEPGYSPGLTDCLQPVFTFELPTVGDRIFNGPYGYRAQYWVDPLEGLKANAFLIATLTPQLLATVDERAEPRFAKFDVCASLRATSAKLWIQEIPSLLVSPTIDLKVERWYTEAQRDVQLAKWGLSAPEEPKFHVKGALLDPWGNEVVPSRKVTRHYDIHHYGFS